MKYGSTFALLIALTFTLGAISRLHAQPRTGQVVQETDDEFKVTTYKKFVDNREPNPALAKEKKEGPQLIARNRVTSAGGS